MEEDDISKLLRLKRFEQPPKEYFESFLEEFKERQRAQLLREPAWRIVWDRVCAFWGEHLPARIGYGLASTAVLVAAGIASLNILESRPGMVVAANAPHAAIAPQQEVASADTPAVSLARNPDILRLPALPTQDRTASFSPPHSVMGAQPVSYELTSSF